MNELGNFNAVEHNENINNGGNGGGCLFQQGARLLFVIWPFNTKSSGLNTS